MKTVLKLAAVLLGGLFAAGSAQSRNQLGEQDPVAVTAGKSYLFFRSEGKANVRFLREVTPAQRSAWKAERNAAYAKARAKYVKKLAAWRKSEKQWLETHYTARTGMVRLPKPDPVTDETFGYPAPELSNFVELNGGREFSREEVGRTYFIAVEPGTYAIYGSVIVTPNGSAGTCLCMGSVRFEAKPGRIMDLGRFARPEKKEVSHLLIPPAADAPRPARLAKFAVEPADLHASGKMPNYFGVMIDRLPAIPGVLSYRRDTPVDVKTSTDAPPIGGR